MGSTSSSKEEGNSEVKLHTIDPVRWLKSKNADPDFIKHVNNALNGLYNPIHIHPKLDIIISAYLNKLMPNRNKIPHGIEMLCKSFIAQSDSIPNETQLIINHFKHAVAIEL